MGRVNTVTYKPQQVSKRVAELKRSMAEFSAGMVDEVTVPLSLAYFLSKTPKGMSSGMVNIASLSVFDNVTGKMVTISSRTAGKSIV